jgi:hypothetical protein
MRLSTRTGPLYGGLSLTLCAAAVAAMPLAAQEKAQETVIDSQRSTIHHSRGQIHMLSAAARDHTTNIPISLGTIRESTAPQHSLASKRRG